MRHLMSPLDFSVEELDDFWISVNDIESIRKNIRTCLCGEKITTLFMGQVPYPFKP